MSDDMGTADVGSEPTISAEPSQTVTSSVPIFTTPQVNKDAAAAPSFESLVPEEYKNAPWLEPIKKSENPTNALFKQVGEMQKLIGQRPPEAPTATSTPEQVSAWRKAVGVPEVADAYVYEPPKFEGDQAELSNFLADKPDEQLLSYMKKEAHRLNIPAETFKEFAKSFDVAMATKMRDNAIAGKQEAALQDQQFEELGQRLLGANFESSTKQANEIFKKLVPPNIQPLLAQVDNNSLIVMTAAFNGFAQKYMKEDTQFSGKGMEAAPMSAEERRLHGIKLQSDPHYRDPGAGKLHLEAVRKVQEFYGTGPYAKKSK